jgi:crotonobetainyl-CoA:carnitine CoA-transferase CaiB-like acyl-CoA transferase
VTPAPAGLRVVEIAGDIAGPYCTKLLADLGAEVTKIEPPSGDPMRGWGPFPGGVPDPNRSGLFEYLNAGKCGTTVDLKTDASAAGRLIADAHVLAEALPPGMLDRLGLGVPVLETLRCGLVVVRISAFGRCGPLRDRVATPLTVQAASGWINTRDPDRPPVQAGARISEYVAGGYGALGALTALRTFSGNGINCLTGQHWLDTCAMLGLPEYGEHQIAIMLGGPERVEFYERLSHGSQSEPWPRSSNWAR